MKLKNKVAFITGGTSGIGLETAKLFQAEGAHVVLVGSNDERLAAAGKELDGQALLVRADSARWPTSNMPSKKQGRSTVISMLCSPTLARRLSLRSKL